MVATVSRHPHMDELLEAAVGLVTPSAPYSASTSSTAASMMFEHDREFERLDHGRGRVQEGTEATLRGHDLAGAIHEVAQDFLQVRARRVWEGERFARSSPTDLSPATGGCRPAHPNPFHGPTEDGRARRAASARPVRDQMPVDTGGIRAVCSEEW